MQKFSLISKSLIILAFVVILQNTSAQNALAQNPSQIQPKPAKQVDKLQLPAPALPVKTPENNNIQTQEQPQPASQADLTLEQYKEEIEKIKADQQKIAEKIRSLSPEHRQIIKDEIRRHRETMRDLLGEAWNDPQLPASVDDVVEIPQDFAPAGESTESAPTAPSAPQLPSLPTAPKAK